MVTNVEDYECLPEDEMFVVSHQLHPVTINDITTNQVMLVCTSKGLVRNFIRVAADRGITAGIALCTDATFEITEAKRFNHNHCTIY